ncbi:putative indolepyruvate decarboxylase family protein [Saccharomycopsis crataegensis]|uniref:2-hydroxyacyl-CoA lyase n=1 Tax=Saccharomycopsis crataegensis TaxID=43959 RepID=A0AAV5QR74_9ASCO|nr:putative indolepyruvate decarboxylase family protein [Saccharomycopsis crataegensis]
MSTGAEVIAQSLKNLGVEVVFGLVGIPVIEETTQAKGIKFIGFRNEQAASYAASVYGYLTGRPGVLLVVGGPGIIHAMAGIFNSQINCWPLMILGGSVDNSTRYKGGFQELDQLAVVKQFTKFQARPNGGEDIGRLMTKAYRYAMFGQPGCSYIDFPGDLIQKKMDHHQDLEEMGEFFQEVPKSLGDPNKLRDVVAAIKTAKFPLVIIGKGAAYGDASKELSKFIEKHQLPFIATPMGKGVVSDYCQYNVSSARSMALKMADVVLVFGARLNWILHFGSSRKFSPRVKLIQVNNHAEEIGENYQNLGNMGLGLLGDIKKIAKQLLDDTGLQDYKFGPIPEAIVTKIHTNNRLVALKEDVASMKNGYLNYHVVYRAMREFLITRKLQDSTILVSEGANTMDISRVSFPITVAKHRLDAGTNSTMGVGLGYCIASKLAKPWCHVLAIEGDSAFGFSGMEIETAVRYNLPMIIVVMNNSGIYHGNVETSADVKKPIELSKDTRYDLMAESLGAKGYFVNTLAELDGALNECFGINKVKVNLINVIIEPGEQKKVAFNWQQSQQEAKL